MVLSEKQPKQSKAGRASDPIDRIQSSELATSRPSQQAVRTGGTGRRRQRRAAASRLHTWCTIRMPGGWLIDLWHERMDTDSVKERAWVRAEQSSLLCFGGAQD